MKILLATLEYPPFKGGVANYYYNLVKHWPRPLEIKVLDNNEGQLMFKSNFLPWVKSLFALFNRIAKHEFDYLLIGQVLPLGTVAMLISFFKPLKYSIIIHGLDFSKPILNRRKRVIIQLIFRRAHKIICANSYVLSLIKDFDPSFDAKLSLINPGVISLAPTVDEQELLNVKEKYSFHNNFILFSLGRLVKRKGFDMVIKAVNDLGQDSGIKYFIAGTGPELAQLQSLVAPNLLNRSIYFLNSISEQEKWTWLSIADLFIMPARKIGPDFEGFGIVYLEANLCHKPVIAGKSGGVSDAVISSFNGILLNPDSLEEIKAAILKLKNDPSLCQQMGENGFNRLTDFSWDKQAQRFYQVISS